MFYTKGTKEIKAKSILLLAIPDEYQLSLLEVHGAAVSNEDANQKFLRALPSSWNSVALIMRNKTGIDDLDIDGLYNNLKVFEADIKVSSGSSLNSQNVTFLTAEDTSSCNEVNTANGVSTASGHNSQGQASSSSYTDDLMFSFFSNQSSGPQLDDEDLEQIDHDDLKEIDIIWQVLIKLRLNALTIIEEAILQGNVEQQEIKGTGMEMKGIRARTTPEGLYIAQDEPTEFAFMAYTSNSSGSDTEAQSCSKNYVKAYEKLQKQFDEQRQTLSKANLEIVAYQLGLESVKAYNAITRLKNQLDETLREKDDLKAKLEQFETSSKNLSKLINIQLSSKDKTGLRYGDQLNENDSSGSELFNSVFDSRSGDGDDNQTNNRFKKDNGYHAVPHPLTGNYMPPLADLFFAGLDDSVYSPTTNKTSASVSQVETSITPPSNTSVEMLRVESVRPSRVIIEDWVSDDDEDIFQSNDLQATDKPSFKKIEFTNARNESVKPKQAEQPRITTQNPKVDRRDWNGKMTQKLGLGFGSTKKACFVCGILTRSGKLQVSTGKKSSLRATTSTSTFRPVNTATHTNRVNVSKLRTNAFHKSHSPIRRSFYKPTAPNTRISNEKVNTVRVNGVNTAGQTAVSDVKGNGVTAVKASVGCVWKPKMTDLNNVSKENSGSWVSKRGNPQQALKNKGIFDSGCSRHMTGNKDFLIDYQDIDGGFVAFGGSARGGKITGKGKIRTDKLDFEDVFFVKELKFNLFFVSQMCDKKNSVLFIETECLVLSPDFKLLDASQVLLRVPRQSNMYSFDLKNVVPSGDLTCLFAKATIDESKLWHRRLGHVNFKTMNKLVKGNLVRDLPLKIFKNDHTFVACQKGKQHKASCKAKLVSSISQPLQMLHMDLFGPTSVRSINHNTYCLVVADDFSRDKKEFSIARTPQQNGVAERKNSTLIKAARTMLADSLLPIVFWAEAVNTTCYVLNRVLVTKPHNKTPYELIIAISPSINFIRPFGCPVTILNTLDPLGKFDGKAEEGFLVGYSVNNKAFKVFNFQTRKVEENLHVNFLENKPNVAGQGPNWLFDIDSLTNSMNYQPITVRNQTNKNEGPQEANGNTGLKQSVDVGQSEEKNVSTQQYVVFPLWSSISSSYKSSDENNIADDSAGEYPIQKPASKNEQALKNVFDKMMDQEKEATKQSGVVRKEFEAQCNRQNISRKATKASNTNSFNTVSTPVNAARTSRTYNDVGSSFVPLGGSFLNDPLMPDLEDTVEV
ncbi:putative ribonuclease H-like domain-containing protein [Tanacetum coccineum]